jgi:hypothetical protein
MTIEFPDVGPLAYTSDRRDEHGMWWRWAPPEDEPGEMLIVAGRIARPIAAEQARKSCKTYLMTMGLQPSAALYVFACDHPDAAIADIDILLEFLPDGRRIERALRSREP